MDNLQPDFLFVKGDGNPKFSIQDVGQMYLIEAPFLVIGIIMMLMTYPTIAVFMLYWILAAIIPAATARETPHALRILNSLPTWHIFIAFGLLRSIDYISGYNKRGKILGKLFTVSLIFIYGFS